MCNSGRSLDDLRQLFTMMYRGIDFRKKYDRFSDVSISETKTALVTHLKDILEESTWWSDLAHFSKFSAKQWVYESDQTKMFALKLKVGKYLNYIWKTIFGIFRLNLYSAWRIHNTLKKFKIGRMERNDDTRIYKSNINVSV